MSDYNELLAQSLSRIESKLDEALATINRHEGALSMLKWLFGSCLATFSVVAAFLGLRHG